MNEDSKDREPRLFDRERHLHSPLRALGVLFMVIFAGASVWALHASVGRYLYDTETRTIRVQEINAVESCFYKYRTRRRLRWYQTENFRSSDPSDPIYYCGAIREKNRRSIDYVLPNSGWTFGLHRPREELHARFRVGCSYKIRYLERPRAFEGPLGRGRVVVREITDIVREDRCDPVPAR